MPEELPFAGAVDAGGVHDFLGEADEEGADHDDVECGDRGGDDDGPEGVEQAELLDDEVAGDDAGVEQQADEYEQQQGSVALLDYGQVKDLPDQLRLAYANLVLAIANGDPLRAAESYRY